MDLNVTGPYDLKPFICNRRSVTFDNPQNLVLKLWPVYILV